MSSSLGRGKPDRSPLLAKVLTAHGGLEDWERVRSLRADVVFGGPFWSMLGWAYTGLKLTASLDARREHLTLGPFTAPDRDRGLRRRTGAAEPCGMRSGPPNPHQANVIYFNKGEPNAYLPCFPGDWTATV